MGLLKSKIENRQSKMVLTVLLLALAQTQVASSQYPVVSQPATQPTTKPALRPSSGQATQPAVSPRPPMEVEAAQYLGELMRATEAARRHGNQNLLGKTLKRFGDKFSSKEAARAVEAVLYGHVINATRIEPDGNAIRIRIGDIKGCESIGPDTWTNRTSADWGTLIVHLTPEELSQIKEDDRIKITGKLKIGPDTKTGIWMVFGYMTDAITMDAATHARRTRSVWLSVIRISLTDASVVFDKGSRSDEHKYQAQVEYAVPDPSRPLDCAPPKTASRPAR